MSLVDPGDRSPGEGNLPGASAQADVFDSIEDLFAALDDTPLVCGIENPETCESCQ